MSRIVILKCDKCKKKTNTLYHVHTDITKYQSEHGVYEIHNKWEICDKCNEKLFNYLTPG